MVTEMDQQQVSFRTWQQTFENKKKEEKKTKQFTRKMFKIKQYLQQRRKLSSTYLLYSDRS